MVGAAMVWSESAESAPSATSAEPRLVPHVDTRMELANIVVHLASQQTISSERNPVYARAVEAHFRAFANHPFIERLRTELERAAREDRDIGGWELPSLALHLGPLPSLGPLVAITHETEGGGWDDRRLLNAEFLGGLSQFYVDARVANFFDAERDYYARVDRRYEDDSVPINRPWLDDFFGLQRTERYEPVLSLLGDGAGDYVRVNYGNNRRNTHTVIAPTAFDAEGIPLGAANPAIARAILHEYLHAFTNQLIDKHAAELRGPAGAIVGDPRVAASFKDTFYGTWDFMLYESLVRASSIAYLSANHEIQTTPSAEIAAQTKAGFFWIGDLVNLLDRYAAERKRYPTLDAFMPEIESLFSKIAADLRSRQP